MTLYDLSSSAGASKLSVTRSMGAMFEKARGVVARVVDIKAVNLVR